MKNFKSFFNSLSLARKMAAIYIAVFGILCTITLLALQITLDFYDGKMYEKSLQELDYFTQQVDRELDALEKFSYDLALDYNIQSQLSQIMEAQNQSEYNFRMSQIRSRLNQEAGYSDQIAEMIYTDKKWIKYMIGNHYLEVPELIYSQMLEEFAGARGAYVCRYPTEEFPYMVSGRDIRKYLDASMDYMGSLMFVVDVKNLIRKHVDELATKTSTLYVWNGDMLLYEDGHGVPQSHFRFKGEKEYEIVKIKGKKYFACQLASAKTGWIYLNLFSYDEIYAINTYVRYGLVLGLFVLFAGAGAVTRKLALVITRPLEQLTAAMELVEDGQFTEAASHLPQENRKDEIGILTQEFGRMINKITELIHENYEKQLLIKDTQYRALQAQIKPHFLYNTMNSINWLIRSGRGDEASRMTVAFSDFLRASFSKELEDTLEKEVELVENYMNIQKIRYQRRVEFLLETRGELGRYLVPRMILQPLVENAINYGVDNTLKLCRIQVRVREEDQILILEVEDDGPGMSSEELEAVRTFTMKPKGNGIGIKNISERLKLFFSGEAVMEIWSQPGEGTRIHIEIPKKERDIHVQDDCDRR